MTRHLETNEFGREKLFVIFIPKYSSFVSWKWKISRRCLCQCPAHCRCIVPHWISPIKQWSEPLWAAADKMMLHLWDLGCDKPESLLGEIRNIYVGRGENETKPCWLSVRLSDRETLWQILVCNFYIPPCPLHYEVLKLRYFWLELFFMNILNCSLRGRRGGETGHEKQLVSLSVSGNLWKLSSKSC